MVPILEAVNYVCSNQEGMEKRRGSYSCRWPSTDQGVFAEAAQRLEPLHRVLEPGTSQARRYDDAWLACWAGVRCFWCLQDAVSVVVCKIL